MRPLLASSIGVACAAVLTLPLAPPSAARAVPAPAARAPQPPGSTQSLPLRPLADSSDRAVRLPSRPVGAQGLSQQKVHPFSLVGVVWNDPGTELHGRVQVRTRSAATGRWSPWRDLETHHDDDAPDRTSPERRRARGVRGSTAPLWVGASNGVQVQAVPEPPSRRAGLARTALPSGLRVELVDPGGGRASRPRTRGTPPLTPAQAAASGANAKLVPLGARVIPPLDRRASLAQAPRLVGGRAGNGRAASPFIGPRPRIVTRAGWGADESLRERTFVYSNTVKAAFVHHSASGNNYSCDQAPALLRGIYRYHVTSLGWRDIGYNFLVDKCGTIYEGRAGGVAAPVRGAHTLGFNTASTGIAVLGSFSHTDPPPAVMQAIARLTAWKLGLYGRDPNGRTVMVSSGGNKFPRGRAIQLNVISGHRDGFVTDCPGRRLYDRLGSARRASARLQGR